MKFKKIFKICITTLLIIVFILISNFLYKYDSIAIFQLINIIKNDEESNLLTYELEDYQLRIKDEIAKTDNEEMLKNGYYCLGAVEYLMGNYEMALSYMEKSVVYINNTGKNDTGKSGKEMDMMIYSALSSIYVVLGDLDKSDIFFDKAKKFALDNGLNEELSELYYAKAKAMLSVDASVEDVVELIRKSVEYTNDNSIKIRNDLFLGSIYKLKGEFNLALEYTVAALNLAISDKNNVLINKCIIRLGENYYVEENYVKAISIYEALIESGRLYDKENKLFVYGYLLHSYAQVGEYNQYEKYKQLYIEITKGLDEKLRVKELNWLYIMSACIEVDFLNIQKAKADLEEAKKLQVQDGIQMYYNIDLWRDYAITMINYLENDDYDKTITDLELVITKNHERGVEIDITPIAIRKIMKLSFDNEDYSTLIKYIKIEAQFYQRNASQVYTDMAFNETNSFIQSKKIAREKIKVGILTILIIIMIYEISVINKKKKEIVKLNAELEKNNKLDSLTKVYNKGYLIQVLNELCNLKENIKFIMIDIDYFKKYNDNYGHLYGDEALINVAIIIQNVFKDDLVFRYGGEEFSVVSTRDKIDVIKSINVLQSEIYNQKIKHEYSEISDRITLSIGLAASQITKKEELTDLIKTADEKLYESKKSGRNRFTY